MSLSIYTRTETCQVTTCDVEKSTKASRRDLLEGAGIGYIGYSQDLQYMTSDWSL